MPTTVLTIGRAKVRVSDVNMRAKEDSEALFNLCNEKYEKKIAAIAQRIAEDPTRSRIIMLSGPSASGKTTSSLKLQKELERLGCGAVAISLDDFFKNREDTPLLPDGTRDFESSAALDTALLKKCLGELISDGRALLPTFNFKLGHREENPREVVLGKGHVAVVEGLHALNPDITGLLPEGSVLKMYVSVSSDLVTDSGDTVLCARDLRLIRRAIRDYHFRGSDVDSTLDIWDAVCRGEDQYVRPYKKYADFTVNSALSCEPCLFRAFATELFSAADIGGRHAERIRHILDGLEVFEPMSPSIMPGTCVLREFYGDSDYYQ